MKKTILVLLLSAGGFAAVWNFEPTPIGSTAVAAPSTTAPSTSESGSATGSSGTQTVAGTAESSDYGTVQVQVTFSGTKIEDIQLVQQPRSGRAVNALPRLREEALRAQSADIDTVSGATSTSDSYVKSLQAAIDAKGS
ncbi:FMN-binding protein [Amycolatopsis sp. NPDC059657]|uniref:FMN-binding protein n=1 Tax=Amycolatopsis sp. NPDC059657 TaxID=3346899 RepID=UPI00366D69B1